MCGDIYEARSNLSTLRSGHWELWGRLCQDSRPLQSQTHPGDAFGSPMVTGPGEDPASWRGPPCSLSLGCLVLILSTVHALLWLSPDSGGKERSGLYTSYLPSSEKTEESPTVRQEVRAGPAVCVRLPDLLPSPLCSCFPISHSATQHKGLPCPEFLYYQVNVELNTKEENTQKKITCQSSSGGPRGSPQPLDGRSV